MAPLKRLDQRLAAIPTSIWSEITKIDELKGQWIGGSNLSPYILGRLKKSVLVTSTGASTRIEGARLEDTDVEKLMQRGLALQKFNSREKGEVRGYYELLSKVFDSFETLKFTEGAIKHLHQELLKYVEKDGDHRGNYKRGDNAVRMVDAEGNVVGTIFQTLTAHLTAGRMHKLIEWTRQTLQNDTYHPLLTIGNFIIEFLSIHPFEDGNGRLSRILTNLMLLQEGYAYMPYVSHEKLIEDEKVDYYLALRRSQKTFDKKGDTVIPWLEFFLKIIRMQSQVAIGLLSYESIEQLLSPNQLMVWDYLQKVAEEASPGEIAKQTGVVRATVTQAINKLMDLKKIERIGQGRTTRYRKI